MRRIRPVDVLIAAVLLVWGLLEAILLEGAGPTPERIGWAIQVTVPIAFRRRAPVGVPIALAALVILRVVVAQGDTAEEGAMPFPALLVALFSAAVYARTLRLAVIAGLAVYAALVTVIALTYFTGDPEPSDFAVLSFFAAAAWTAGYFVRRRAESGEVQAREAVDAERARIARELHDIIGHSMSAIALQAGAAETLLRSDPDKAATHLQAVQRTTREALAEMRRLMGVLREDEAQYAPQPGLGTLEALVGQARAAGLDVEVVEVGERPELPPGVDLAAYRIVQESLTNARKHAGNVRTRVTIRYEDEAVDVEVLNDRGSALSGRNGSGRGLAGMAERARLFGGTLESGIARDGGFRVHARLPVESRS